MRDDAPRFNLRRERLPFEPAQVQVDQMQFTRLGRLKERPCETAAQCSYLGRHSALLQGLACKHLPVREQATVLEMPKLQRRCGGERGLQPLVERT